MLNGKKLLAISALLSSSHAHAILAAPMCSSGDIGGQVFLDLPVNGDKVAKYGIKEAYEPGLEGISVSVVDNNGNSQSTTTDAAGLWSVDNPSFPVRVQYSWNKTWLQNAPSGSISNTSVQFVTASTCDTGFGLHDSSLYSQVNPKIAMSCYINGAAEGSDEPGLVSIPYSSQGLNNAYENFESIQGTGPRPSVDAKVSQVGSVWGEAWQSNKERLFLSTFLKRHSGMADGPGYVYIMDYSDVENASLMGKFNLQGVTPANGGAEIDLGSICRAAYCANAADNTVTDDYVLSGLERHTKSRDLDAFAKVGAMSFGDIDMQPSSNNLWLVNIFQNALIKIDVGGEVSGEGDDFKLPSTLVEQYALTGLKGLPVCVDSGGDTTGVIRPWALSFSRGKGYLGLVCDGSAFGWSENVQAYVLSFDPDNIVDEGLSAVLTFPLDDKRSELSNDRFHYWLNDYSDLPLAAVRADNVIVFPQPILSDIEFDPIGNMYLNIMDRLGHQLSYNSYKPLRISLGDDEEIKPEVRGEILKACHISGEFILEGKGGCTINYSDMNDSDSVGKQKLFGHAVAAGEFFDDDAGNGASTESGKGALLLLMGSNELVSLVLDPHPAEKVGGPYFYTQGINTFSLDDGSMTNWYSVNYSKSTGLSGKTSGLGDIELLTKPAPIEIGNRVWQDDDGNGLQDAGEAGISGVTITLACGEGEDKKTASTITNNKGQYYFSNAISVVDGVTSASFMEAGKSCVLSADMAGLGMSLTIPNADNKSDNNALTDLLDSDAMAGTLTTTDTSTDTSTVTVKAEIAITLGQAGENNHSVDFGFKPECIIDTVNVVAMCDDHGKTVTVELGEGVNNPTLDAGIYQTARLGSYVWNDLNADGIHDPRNEAGISGVTVALLDGHSRPVLDAQQRPMIQTTGDNGAYQFNNLTPNKPYIVQFTPPNGYKISPQDKGGNDQADSYIDVFTGKTVAIELAAGENNLTRGTGIYQPISLGHLVWDDTNANGIQDNSEIGIADIVVTLLGGVDNLTTPTDLNGEYLFTNLLPSISYTVKFSKPAGYVFSPQNKGNVADSDADTETGETGNIILKAGEDNLTLDAGMYKPSSLGDRVWNDINANGTQDDGEAGIAGIEVSLLDEAGTPVKDVDNNVVTKITDDSGFYRFDGLMPNKLYAVSFKVRNGYAFSPKKQQPEDSMLKGNEVDSNVNSSGKTEAVKMVAGEHNPTLDAGLYQSLTLGNYVWIDSNEDGVQGEDEIPVAGIPVKLYEADGTTLVDSKITDEDGLYLFTDVVPGDYVIAFITPENTSFTNADLGGNDAKDSDVDASGRVIVTAVLDQNNDSIDAGLIPAGVKGRVWIDNNSNNDIDDGIEAEYGVVGVRINLMLVDDEDTLAAKTTTGTDGLYSFDSVLPGTYYVKFEEPGGMQFVQPDIGTDDTDSDADVTTGDTTQFTLKSGDLKFDLDAGVLPGELGDRIWLDVNLNHLQDKGEPGIPNITVRLLDEMGKPTDAESVTDENGFYSFNGLYPSVYSVVFDIPNNMALVKPDQGTDNNIDSDADIDTEMIRVTINSGTKNQSIDAGIVPAVIGDKVWFDMNADGIQDADEKGIQGVTVQLISHDGDTVLDTTLTDTEGLYYFSVVPGDYLVKVVVPEGSLLSPATQGSDGEIDSDVEPSTGLTTVIKVISGDNDDRWDAGILPAKISGHVIHDINFDAVKDTNEKVIKGVTMMLSGTDVFENLVPMTMTETDAEGAYHFSVPAGEYTIIEMDPEGYESTGSVAGTLGSSTVSKNSLAVVLNSGEHSEDNDFFDNTTGIMSGQVREDIDQDGDVKDTDDTGIVDVDVAIELNDKNIVADTAKTDDSGRYNFTNVQPVDAIVREVDPEDYISTADIKGANVNTIQVLLPAGGNSIDNDSLDSVKEVSDIIVPVIVNGIKLVKTAYAGHDNGEGCATYKVKKQLIIVDIDKSKDEPVTYCFEVTNPSDSYLTDIVITDDLLNISHNDLSLLTDPQPVALAPLSVNSDAKLIYYYEMVAAKSMTNIAKVEARQSDVEGAITGGKVSSSDDIGVELILIIDPPSALKTVIPEGKIAMRWQMVWINDSKVTAPDVIVYDEVPVDTHYRAMTAAQFVSADGVYCEARGDSMTERCYYEAPSIQFPRGRVIWKGVIASDPSLTTEAEASHEVVIRFVSELDKTDSKAAIKNQATSAWDFDGNGEPEVTVLTENQAQGKDTVFIPNAVAMMKTVVKKTELQIPTLSEWAVIMLSGLMGLVVIWQARRGRRID